MLTFADRGCHVVSVTDLYGRILGFLDRSSYFFFQVAAQLYSRGWVEIIIILKCAFQILTMKLPPFQVWSSCCQLSQLSKLRETLSQISQPSNLVSSVIAYWVTYKDFHFVGDHRPRGLRHEISSPAQTLGSWVRIPLDAYTSVYVYSVFVLSCVPSYGLIPHPRSPTDCV
jgi:hypothetical protein